MRRHRSGSAGYNNRTGLGASPNASSTVRSFESETNPTRPVRPSPLSSSTIHGIPLDMYDRIRSFPLFLSAPDAFLAAIGKHLRPQSHAPHDYILTEGDEAKAMYWLVRGAVAVTSRDGESTYAELKPGAFFGEIGILMSIPRTATIVARSKCLLVSLRKEDLVKELPGFPDVERTIRDEAAERLAILNRKKKEKEIARGIETLKAVNRGGKRLRASEDGDIEMPDINEGRAARAQNKKRKSPSPSIAETAMISGLGDGLVNVRQLLRELPLFSNLPPELLHFLGLNAQPTTYPPFTDIVKQDSQGREIFFIVRGEVEVIDEKVTARSLRTLSNGVGRQSRHCTHVKARLKQGQYFGEVVSLSLAPRRTATVRSITSVECLVITGDVLGDFWLRCPPELRQQVESTARERLEAAPLVTPLTSPSLPQDPLQTENIMLEDGGDSTHSMAKLAIADQGPRSPRKNHVMPKVTFTQPRLDGSPKPSGVEDRTVIEPADPDPYLNVDLEKSFDRARRSSLAPPIPEESETEMKDARTRTGGSLVSSTRRPSHRGRFREASPEKWMHPPSSPIKRRPSQYSQGIFPDSILVNIFRRLELPTLMRLRTISLHWSKLLKESPHLLHELDLRMYNRRITNEVLINYICPFVGSRPRIIDISNCFHVSDEGFMALTRACGANVTTWKMKSVWDITAQAILEMATRAKGLEEVDLSNCRKVSDNLLQRVVGWVVQGQPHNIMAHGRHAAARSVGAPVPIHPPPGTVFGCPKLRVLTLSYCKHVTDRSMAHMAYHAASRLEEIDLTRCTTITDLGFQHWGQFSFVRLTKLCLADCTYLTDNAIIYLANAAKGLRELDLSFCCALSDTATEVLALSCQQLRNLNLSFCGSAVSDVSLRSIGLHLLELNRLSVRGCVRVTGNGVEAIIDGCHKLQYLDVSQCKNLTPWLDLGNLSRFSHRIQFETVARGRDKSTT